MVLARIAGHRDGAAAIELALVLPVCVALLIAAMEIAMALFAGIALEAGVREAARFGVTGRDTESARAALIRNIVDRHSFGLFAADDVVLETRVYDRFDDIGLPEPFTDSSPANGRYDEGEAFVDINDNGIWDPLLGRLGVGGASEIVVYTARVRWNWMTGLFTPLVGDGLDLRSSLVVRNEPFVLR